MDHPSSGPRPDGRNRMSIAFLSAAHQEAGPRSEIPFASVSATHGANDKPARCAQGSLKGQQNNGPALKAQISFLAAKKGRAENKVEDVDDLSRHDGRTAGGAETPTLRPPRPTYKDEQKFFIMWARIVKEHSWPEIENTFREIFGERTKGGLTSVYYRTRKDWNLEEVLKSEATSEADREAVRTRARHMYPEFLRSIGYEF